MLKVYSPDTDEPIYKRYVHPETGNILELTKPEFDRVVDVFRMLQGQDEKRQLEKRKKETGLNETSL